MASMRPIHFPSTCGSMSSSATGDFRTQPTAHEKSNAAQIAQLQMISNKRIERPQERPPWHGGVVDLPAEHLSPPVIRHRTGWLQEVFMSRFRPCEANSNL